jgi:hypothetical protein
LEVGENKDFFNKRLLEIRNKLKMREGIVRMIPSVKTCYQLTKSEDDPDWNELLKDVVFDTDCYELNEEEIEAEDVTRLKEHDFKKINNVCRELGSFCYYMIDEKKDYFPSKYTTLFPMITLLDNEFTELVELMISMSKKIKKKTEEIWIFEYDKFLVTNNTKKTQLKRNHDLWVSANIERIRMLRESIMKWKNYDILK